MTFPDKKNCLYISILFIGFFIYIVYNLLPHKTIPFSPAKTLVAITQISPHPSLDTIRGGITDVLKEAGVSEDNIIFQNAQGNVSTAAQISQKFSSFLPKVIVPITTPSAQSAYAAAKPYNIPIVFVAVSDPIAAKLSTNLKKGNDGVTGIYDQAPIDEQANLMIEILGDNTQHLNIGILYNPGEANSVSIVEQMSEALRKLNISVIQVTASATTEVSTATRSLVGKVNAIYIPNDNTFVSALDAVLKVSQEHKIPVFSSDPESVERGCLATVAPDQYEIGRQAGRMVREILKGTDVKEIDLEKAKTLTLVLNQQTAKHLGINFSEAILARANKIINVSINSENTSLQPGAKK
jgi:putative ABC transport system substrate-binding protein